MSRLDRLLLAAGAAAVLVGVLYVATALAQSPQDLQRQIDRLQMQVDSLSDDARARERAEAQKLQALHERLAATEREMELNRRVIWGFIVMLLGNFGVSGLTLHRVSRLWNHAPRREGE